MIWRDEPRQMKVCLEHVCEQDDALILRHLFAHRSGDREDIVSASVT
jgi:hypothetical protein